jgi:hypothetical protein
VCADLESILLITFDWIFRPQFHTIDL